MGYSALLLEDAYLKIDKNIANPGIDLMDDLKYIGTRTEPSGQSCHKNIIYHENALVPGNIRHMKAAMHGSLSKEKRRVFIERWMREGRTILTGGCPSRRKGFNFGSRQQKTMCRLAIPDWECRSALQTNVQRACKSSDNFLAFIFYIILYNLIPTLYIKSPKKII